MFVARLTDRNGSTFYTTVGGSLTRSIEDAEQFFTKDMAEMYADPAFNGIPASRIQALNIVGEAVEVP